MPHRDRSIGGRAYIFCHKNAMTKPDDAFTVESHFEGKDDSARQIYDRLLKEAGRFGPVMEEPKKTSIHLVNRTAFAGGGDAAARPYPDSQKRPQALKPTHSQIR